MSLNFKFNKHLKHYTGQALWGLLLLLFAGACKTNAPVTQKTSSAPMIAKEEVRIAFEAAFNDGMKYYMVGDYNEAIKSFEKAQHTYTGSAACCFMLGKLYSVQNNLVKAKAYTELATQLDGSNKFYFEQLAHLYEQQKQYAEAGKVYKKLTSLNPETPDYYYDVAAMYFYQNNIDESLKAYGVIENRFGKTLELTRQKQQLYLRVNKLDEALKEGAELIKDHPQELDYQIAQAEFLYTNGKYTEALKLLEKVVQQDPENITARLNLANIYHMQGNPEKVFSELKICFASPALDIDTRTTVLEDFIKTASSATQREQAKELALLNMKYYPSEGRTYVLLADLCLKNDQKSEALTYYKKGLLYNVGDHRSWLEVLNLQYNLKQYDSLVLDTDRALEAYPNQSSFWYYGGMGYYMKKDYAKAVTYLEQCQKLSASQPEIKIMTLSLLGDVYNELKNYSKSDASYEEVLKLDRNNEHVLNNYSYFLSLRKEKLELARELSERLMKKHPGNPSYIDTYGWVLYQLKDYQNARKYLEVAVATQKKGIIMEHYGDVLYQLGEKEEALTIWKEAKLLGGTSSFLEQKIADKKLYE